MPLHVKFHVALQGSDNANILKQAEIKSSGGHLVQLIALDIFPRVRTNLQDLVIVTAEGVSALEQMYNRVYRKMYVCRS